MNKLNSLHSTTDSYMKQKEMTELHFEVLPPIKLPLIKRIYKDHYPSAKAKKDELCIVGAINGTICTVVRFRSIEQYRLLTGLLVVPVHRGQGVGSQLLGYCESHILTSQDYCFAYSHLESFYCAHGFRTLAPNEIPQSLMQLLERYLRSGKDLIPMRYMGKASENNQLL
ncbi:GNAT family N-acetyltransferase [Vibrio aestuarianus]|uniref:GNAT family N-acetyltransferase n=2 Tax=Vibrio aestuarianus TaxID=28171 RepID=A0A9X4J1X2_9VIBR|nr:GNAT family N-acetyltransferase [Vibrio aestuarianus]MDE1309531.1 GNAT family N-acetyltransferase [Vibrio aestuarianus]MDE1359012.1 GNAT family N-acetyltransferase [Vibrio aestuarianus]NGZ19197.1 GNAT family N-acetyltransferase [Vibrio aestuarianus]NGZ94215.1 GNAT family N-acetyltransferase [Vibrio aestuarianus subsp. cardii]